MKCCSLFAVIFLLALPASGIAAVSCSPKSSEAKILRSKNAKDIHPNWKPPSSIGTSWSLELTKHEGEFLSGILVSPRGGKQPGIYVISSEWSCVKPQTDLQHASRAQTFVVVRNDTVVCETLDLAKELFERSSTVTEQKRRMAVMQRQARPCWLLSANVSNGDVTKVKILQREGDYVVIDEGYRDLDRSWTHGSRLLILGE